MAYVVENTIWLSNNINKDVKGLVARFYELADSKVADAGHLMATEVFSEDAVMIGPRATFRGSEEISNSRSDAWETVSSRRHEVKKVFSGKNTVQELILLGEVHMDLINGDVHDSPFSCHIKLGTSREAVPALRITFMEVYPGTPRLIQLQRGDDQNDVLKAEEA